MLVLSTQGAPQRRLLRGRRPKAIEPEPEPTPVATTKVTLVAAQPLPDGERADAWLRAADLEDEVDVFLDVLNQVLQAQRIASADAFSREVAADQALALRVGVGEGEQVADGRWTAARQLPATTPGGGRRTASLRPQERLAAILGGRDVALACEELVLRARLDADRGRPREAALQLRIALAAAVAELEAWTGRADLGGRLEELRGMREAAEAAADEALRGGLGADTVLEVERIIGRIEAALRARTAAGVD